MCPHCATALAFVPAEVSGLGILVDSSDREHVRKAKVRIPAVVEDRAIAVCPSCYRRFFAESDWHGDWRPFGPYNKHKCRQRYLSRFNQPSVKRSYASL